MTTSEPKVQPAEPTLGNLEKLRVRRNQPVATRIKTGREKAGLSQEDVAHALGITSSAVSQWETGRNLPNRPRLLEFCKIVRADLNWVLGGQETRGADWQAINEAIDRASQGTRGVDWQAINEAIDRATGRERSAPPTSIPLLSLPQLPADEPNLVYANAAKEFIQPWQPCSPASFAVSLEDNLNAPSYSYGDLVILDPDLMPSYGDMVLCRVTILNPAKKQAPEFLFGMFGEPFIDQRTTEQVKARFRKWLRDSTDAAIEDLVGNLGRSAIEKNLEKYLTKIKADAGRARLFTLHQLGHTSRILRLGPYEDDTGGESRHQHMGHVLATMTESRKPRRATNLLGAPEGPGTWLDEE